MVTTRSRYKTSSLGSDRSWFQIGDSSRKGRKSKGVGDGSTSGNVGDNVPLERAEAPIADYPILEDCLYCGNTIYGEQEACSDGYQVACSVVACQKLYHKKCVKDLRGVSEIESFRCPQHACYLCRRKKFWRCIICTVASCPTCAPWTKDVVFLRGQQELAICWNHPFDWRLRKKPPALTKNGTEVVSRCLPRPYTREDFVVPDWIETDEVDTSEAETETEESSPVPAPPQYTEINNNVYLVPTNEIKIGDLSGCICVGSGTCEDGCWCRASYTNCTDECNCAENECKNRFFGTWKSLEVVKTQNCGWGVQAAEPIAGKDFVIEYVGEVIDDDERDRRLYDMAQRNEQNFYMATLDKLTVDASLKGNTARFMNHSCDPNCTANTWIIDGVPRLGIFTNRSIKIGEELRWDYRWEGVKIKCLCGSSNCRGFLGGNTAGASSSRTKSRRSRPSKSNTAGASSSRTKSRRGRPSKSNTAGASSSQAMRNKAGGSSSQPKGRRGRPSKSSTAGPSSSQPKSKRGRPSKSSTAGASSSQPKSKRGRPLKSNTAGASSSQAMRNTAGASSSQPKSRRGRPLKSNTAGASLSRAMSNTAGASSSQPKSKRGRPLKSNTAGASSSQAMRNTAGASSSQPKSKRGRPLKSNTAGGSSSQAMSNTTGASSSQPKSKRGRPPKSNTAGTSSSQAMSNTAGPSSSQPRSKRERPPKSNTAGASSSKAKSNTAEVSSSQPKSNRARPSKRKRGQ